MTTNKHDLTVCVKIKLQINTPNNKVFLVDATNDKKRRRFLKHLSKLCKKYSYKVSVDEVKGKVQDDKRSADKQG